MRDPSSISPTAQTLPAEGSLASRDDLARGAPELARGTSIGRYLVLEKIGAGGMGVVYAAYDPKLDRRIALKALYDAGTPEGDTIGRARLVREAKAMARLSHPNVVAVFDVLVESEQVFVAMELVEGTSLRAWLLQKKRGWRQVIDAFLHAGRGLAAAHAAGIVHRDFKLDNVLMGHDGRVKVGDFGLARTVRPSPGAVTPAGAVDIPLAASHEGEVVGTPAYMAPAQLRGAAADERSDQFSFCAALFEGLYGVVPFEGTTLFSLLESMDSERFRAAPASVAVPRWVRAVVLRGLRKRAEDRFPSMAALLAALEVDPGKARQRLVGVASALAVGGLLVGWVARDRRAHALECGAMEQRAENAWGDADRAAVERVFLATGRANAEDTFQRTSAALNAYATQWSALAVTACREDRGEAKSDLAIKRADCFDARLGELQAFVGVLRRADDETLDRAVRGARALSSVEPCAGRDPLQGEPVPSDPAVRAEARTLEQELRRAAALRTAGRFAESLEASTKNLAEADRLGFPPLRARALLALAQAQEDTGDPGSAERTYRRASVTAEGAGSWATAARALIGEAWRASDRGDFERAEERFEHAAVWVDRTGDDLLRGELFLFRGRELVDKGSYDDARANDAKALALFEHAGSDEVTEALNELGVVDDYQGRREEARAYYLRAIERFDQILGPDSQKAGRELTNLGLLEGDEGHDDEAIRDLSRALAIIEKTRGPDHPETAETLSDLALVLAGAGRSAEALPLALRAVAIAEKAFGPDALDVAVALGPLALSYTNLGRPAEAIPIAERELTLRLREGAPINIADARANLGTALFKSGRDKMRARELLTQAREGFLAVGRMNRLGDIAELIGTNGGK